MWLGTCQTAARSGCTRTGSILVLYGHSYSSHTGDWPLSAPNLLNVQIDGRRLHYVEQGKGQPVIFIHGSITDYRSWQFQMEPFSKKYHVISYSRRFAYPNKKVGNDIADNTIECNTADLAELISKLGLTSAHLVGHSFGAFTALYYSYHNPKSSRCDSLSKSEGVFHKQSRSCLSPLTNLV